MRYVIIGNSYAGISAAEAIRDIDKDGEIIILSEEPYLAYGRPLISYWMGGDWETKNMYYRDKVFYDALKIDLRLSTKVKNIDAKRKEAIFADGRTLSFDKLFISTGGTPFIPPTKGLDMLGVSPLTTWGHAEYLQRLSKKAKRVVIIGGGLIGLSAVKGFGAMKKDITIIELSQRVLGLALDEEAGELIHDELNKKGVKIKTGRTVSEIVGTDKKEVKGVRLDNGEELPCELVVMAIGVRPNIEVVKDTDIKINRGIFVDNHMETSVKGIYAGGDVVEAYDFINKDNRVLAILPLAFEQGRVAGSNMAGRERIYAGGMGLNSFPLFGTAIMTMGITITKEGDGLEVIKKKEKDIYKKLVFKDNALVGVIMIKDTNLGGIYTSLITKQVKLADAEKKMLLEGDLHDFEAYREAAAPWRSMNWVMQRPIKGHTAGVR
ncbi:MAG: NAD(P)/FAD-dependent oxidoreductase [Nitrospirae bacterium]|nr:NAD(P)/FAD-dependent oxidoreductase [Nitrospirota bacterium]